MRNTKTFHWNKLALATLLVPSLGATSLTNTDGAKFSGLLQNFSSTYDGGYAELCELSEALVKSEFA